MNSPRCCRFAAAVLMLALAGLPAVRAADIQVKAEPRKYFAITVSATGGSADLSLKVCDPAGKIVRVLAGRRLGVEPLEISWDLADDSGRPVKPGAYVIRVESGWSLSLDPAFGRNGVLAGPPFVNPKDLAVDAAGNLYVLDAGAAVLFKFRPDGAPASDLAGTNRLAAASAPAWSSVAIGPDGRIYLARTNSHWIDVHDAQTGESLGTVGGFFEKGENKEPPWKGGIGYPSLVRLNGAGRLYVACPGYQLLACFDPHQPAKEGAQWAAGSTPGNSKGWGSPGDAGATDGGTVLYLGSAYYTQRNALIKLADRGGKNLPEGVASCTDFYDAQKGGLEPMTDLRGIAYAGRGDVYGVLRDGARIVKFVDSGNRLDSVASTGGKGNDPAKLAFRTLAAAAAAPDGQALYVAEDGEKISHEEEQPGPARVMKYRIQHAVRKEIPVTVSP